MRIRLSIMAGIILSAAIAAPAYQDESLSFSRPTFESVILKDAPKSAVKIYEDKFFVFAYRGAGQAKEAPAFFLHNKSLKKWIEIKKLSTENVKLGRFASGEQASLSVGKKPYVEVPLKVGKTIVFPSKVKFDSETELYSLEFDSWQKKPEHVTRFWIDMDDLEEVFANAK
ncbi:MAG TPA: hypothetical protein VNO14_13510 [Blastocatellia bacterium]|nr:hypothetical protein [Blastocatellia bacterium]